MTRLKLTLAMAAMLGIGMALGSVATHRAEAQVATASPKYQIVAVDRVDKEDPLAIVLNTSNGRVAQVTKGGTDIPSGFYQ